MIEDCNNFSGLKDELKPYTLKFGEDGIMKQKEYSLNYFVEY